jgi:GNAT superfamily N-acetyltransferase
LADYTRVSAEVWGREDQTDEEIARQLADLTVSEPAELRVVAYVDGEPASAAGCTVAGEVARLWGGATRPSLRGRGAYRATLGARLWLARERGSVLALVKAVTTTSAPGVRSLGFTGHGVEHRLRLDLAPGSLPHG